MESEKELNNVIPVSKSFTDVLYLCLREFLVVHQKLANLFQTRLNVPKVQPLALINQDVSQHKPHPLVLLENKRELELLAERPKIQLELVHRLEFVNNLFTKIEIHEQNFSFF